MYKLNSLRPIFELNTNFEFPIHSCLSLPRWNKRRKYVSKFANQNLRDIVGYSNISDLFPIHYKKYYSVTLNKTRKKIRSRLVEIF